jgi:hypothetical protein
MTIKFMVKFLTDKKKIPSDCLINLFMNENKHYQQI